MQLRGVDKGFLKRSYVFVLDINCMTNIIFKLEIKFLRCLIILTAVGIFVLIV